MATGLEEPAEKSPETGSDDQAAEDQDEDFHGE